MIEMRNWGGVWVAAVGAFVVGSDAHSVAGLLPSMAESMGVSVSVAGQSVTVFAFAYALLSPTLAIAFSRLGYRRVLGAALMLFTAGNAVTAVAPTMTVLLAGRVVAAAGAALFTPTAGAVAAGMVAARRRGTALAVVTAGASSALVLGAPAGAAIAAAASWRITLGFIAALGALMLLALRAFPSTPRNKGSGGVLGFSVLRSRRVLVTLGITFVAFAGIFIPYTYMSRAYAPLIEVLPGGISIVLLVFGVTSVAGALLSGPLSDRFSPRWMVVAATCALAIFDLVVVLARDSIVLLAAALLFAGYLSWSILAPQQRLLVDEVPSDAAVLISLNASAGYLGIALAGGAGAVGIELLGDSSFVIVACVLLSAAALWRAMPIRCAAGRQGEPGERE